MSLPWDPSTFYNDEYLQNRETLQLTDVNLKRVTLYDASGNAVSPIPSATSVGDGKKVVTTGGTRVQFDSQACKYVIIVGLDTNTNAITIGGSTVVGAAATRRGVPLFAAQSQRFDVTNMNLLYMDSITNGEGVSFAWFN